MGLGDAGGGGSILVGDAGLSHPPGLSLSCTLTV